MGTQRHIYIEVELILLTMFLLLPVPFCPGDIRMSHFLWEFHMDRKWRKISAMESQKEKKPY